MTSLREIIVETADNNLDRDIRIKNQNRKSKHS